MTAKEAYIPMNIQPLFIFKACDYYIKQKTQVLLITWMISESEWLYSKWKNMMLFALNGYHRQDAPQLRPELLAPNVYTTTLSCKRLYKMKTRTRAPMAQVSQQQSVQTNVQKLDAQATKVYNIYTQESPQILIMPCGNSTLNSDSSI